MEAKLTRLTHEIVHLMAESYIICSSRPRWPVRKLLDTPSYERYKEIWKNIEGNHNLKK